jgi:cytochrome c553
MRNVLALVSVLGLAAACGKNTEPPPPTTGSPLAQPESGPRAKRPAGESAGEPTAGGSPADEARQMFGTLCAACHGTDGTGNGPAAASLNPKPRNYTDAAWQASVTDDELRAIIVKGGQAVGKSAMMPGNPQLADRAEVVDALVQIIRGFGKS